MSEFTKQKQWAEVESTAQSIIEEVAENGEDLNDYLFETIDSSEYAIYNYYHLPIIQFSDNEDYYIDNFGSDDAANVLKDKGLTGLHAAIAFWAFYADVSDKISELSQ